MSTITKIGERKYRARWRTPDGASRSRTFARKADAEDYLDSVGHTQQIGESVDPSAGRILFKDWLGSSGSDQQPGHRPRRRSRVTSASTSIRGSVESN